MRAIGRLFGRGRAHKAGPRELLKAATTPRLAVSAVLTAALAIGGFVALEGALETKTRQREARLVDGAFEQARVNLGAHAAALAGGVGLIAGRTPLETLGHVRRALAEAAAAPADSLLLILSHGEVMQAALGPKGVMDETAARPIRAQAERMLGRHQGGRLLQPQDVALVEGRPVILVHAIQAAAPAAPSAPEAGRHVRSITIALRLDEAMLATMRTRLGLPSLRIDAGEAPEQPGFVSTLLRDGTGAPVATMRWSAAHEGQLVRASAKALVIVLVAIAIFLIVSARRRRREIGELVSEVESQAFDVAMRDPLTGLLNRASFKRKLEGHLDARSGAELIGVVYIDLDRFKQVNDGYGHLKGDELLCAVSERLRDLAETGLSIARLGGDEFAMLVEQQTRPEDIVELAERACACLSVPFQLGEVEASIGGSVGVSICPIDGEDPTELLRRADIAMYRAKTGGRNMTVRFDNSMDSDVQERRVLENDLRRAIERDQLWVAYQPFWASDGQTLIGAEALLRWSHPERGEISPGFFIPIAEEAGLIHDIGEWMYRRAIAESVGWKGVRLALNVSPMQFRRPGLAGRIKQVVTEQGFEPERLEIEITEGVLMEDADAAVKFIRSFREMGVHVALDDFGTGYSSLSYLRRFPFDKLKVDQSFVRALGTGSGTTAIIHSVIALGRALGLTVHAEGVETLEHHIFLRAAGCHHLQGFYFARPMTVAQMQELVDKSLVRPEVARRDLPETEPSSAASAQAAGFDGGVDLAALLREKVAALKTALGDAGAAPEAPPQGPDPAQRAAS